MKADIGLPKALMKLPLEGDLTQEVKDELSKFVCFRYCPKGVHITSIPELRWHLFCKQLAESDKLPLTLGTLDEHVKRVRLQSRTWFQATIMQQQPFDPMNFGYCKDSDGHIIPASHIENSSCTSGYHRVGQMPVQNPLFHPNMLLQTKQFTVHRTMPV